ncbi:MAG TPA: EpsD family peptidyl-prolyl cis-trans isomerase [Sphingobium sp.]|nr:EpsD family peptidyl-prolyl cis-trans isomerase [Sphingobium sp.]
MTKGMKSITATALIAISWMMTGCEKTPTGQVVAVVNGEEITLQELNSELAELNVPENADKKEARRAVLQQIVSRRLLAQQAKQDGVDRDPNYVSAERRMKEQLLVSMYAKKAMDTVSVPDTAAINKFMAQNPTLFKQRTLYKLDQIQFDMPANPASLKALESAHTMEEVATTLANMGIKFTRGSGSFDSGRIPQQMLKQILALKPGEPFVVPAGEPGKGLVNVITGSSPIAMPDEQARAMAAQAYRNQALAKLGEQRLKEAKAKAKIEYQPGYEPPAAKKS